MESLSPKSKIQNVIDFISQKIPFFTEDHNNQKNAELFLNERNSRSQLFVNNIEQICDSYNAFYTEKLVSLDYINEILNRSIYEVGILYEAIGMSNIKSTSLGVSLIPNYETYANISQKCVELDGIIDGEFAFDIKQFQSFEEMIHTKLLKMEQQYPDYVFMVCDFADVNRAQFWNGNVEKNIKQAIDANHKHFKVLLPNGARVEVQKRESITMSESSFNPFRWSEQNYKFILSDSNQFTTNIPFVQFEMFHKENFIIGEDSAYVLLRIIARRIFFELIKSENKANQYCSKITNPELLVKDAIKYLSAICFIDVKTGEAWTFINPFAKNKISVRAFEPYTWDKMMIIDDFRYDIY